MTHEQVIHLPVNMSSEQTTFQALFLEQSIVWQQKQEKKNHVNENNLIR